jgi:3-hydroxy-9,10-secoandrosta-1,3,5(10)-triene-9,17-dione monooxygenase reductase component
MADEEVRRQVQPVSAPGGGTSVDDALFREAIGHFATGVTVITTSHEGAPAGMTASAVASLSLDPVLLLVCISNRLPTHKAIETSGVFVVNVLSEGQDRLARHFATPAPNKFAGIALRDEYQLPVLSEAIAHFVCDVYGRFPGGDHSIFTGLVRECGFIPGKRPLVYFRSAFGALDDRERALARAGVGWDVASLGGIASPTFTVEDE